MGEQDIIQRISFGEAVRRAYRRGEEDESLEPIVLADSSGRPVGRPRDGDSLIFYDIRGEREVELTRSLTEEGFSSFPAEKNLRLQFVTMIEYARGLNVRVAFPPPGRLRNTLTEVLSKSGKRVVKVAESEKAVHIGFFFNGKEEGAFPGEERVIIPSPSAVSYVERPEMSVREVCRRVRSLINEEQADLLVVNLANVDVVGHVEDQSAVIEAVEAVDRALASIVESCRKKGTTLVVTADHGTVEDWLYPDGKVNTGHTRSPVPFILADFSLPASEGLTVRREGELADVAPSVLDLLGIPKPEDMTGESLIIEKECIPRPRARVVLLILDGWGMRSEAYGNLILAARTPNFDSLWEENPSARLQAAGEAVGMPPGTVGNSEAGHLHLGAGRRVFLDRVRIDRAIEDGSFFSNREFLEAMENSARAERALHLMGIVSHYSSHGTIKHLFALLRMAKSQGLGRVFIHAFIGRRGEKPESGAVYLEKVEETCRSLGLGEVATVMGRFWSLDREEYWDRVEKAYRAIVHGEGTRIHPPRKGKA